MSNKYTWVFFNLIAAIGLCLFLVVFMGNISASGAEVGDAGFLIMGAFFGSVYWIYRTIQNWKLCIRADDPNFDKAVAEQEAKE